MRYDFLICMLLAYLMVLLVGKIAETILPDPTDEAYIAEHSAATGDIGGIAGDTVFRAESVEDLLSHDTFTIVSPGTEYSNRGSGYYSLGRVNVRMNAVTLPSGERIAALINEESVQKTGEYYTGESILPVGRIVYEDLTTDETFLNQIEHVAPLSRRDFYIDMYGSGGVGAAQYNTQAIVITIQTFVAIISFILFHAIGAKVGLFPRIWPEKSDIDKKKNKK